MRQESIRILEENIGSNLFDINHSIFFQDMSPKAKETKWKWTFGISSRSKAYTQQRKQSTTTKKMRQNVEWERIFPNDSTEKWLISRIYNELLKLNTQRTDNHIKQIGRRYGQTFFQWRRKNGYQTHEKMFIITSHQGDSNENQLRYHLTPVRMAKKQDGNSMC